MSGPIKRLGFCRDCMRNVEHRRVILILPLRPLYWLLCPLLLPLSLGPWYCFQCGRARFRLPPVRRDAPSEPTEPSPQDTSQFVPAGNWLKEDSLVSRAAQSSRFSRKFRFGIAAKVIDGNSSIDSVCDELDVGTADVTAWICEYYQVQLHQLAGENQRLMTLIRQFLNAVTPRIARGGDESSGDSQWQLDPSQLEETAAEVQRWAPGSESSLWMENAESESIAPGPERAKPGAESDATG